MTTTGLTFEICPNVEEPGDEIEEGNDGFKGTCSNVPGMINGNMQ